MSTKKQSNEKVIVVLASVIAVALIAFGIIGVMSLGSKFEEPRAMKRDLGELDGHTRIQDAVSSLQSPPEWKLEEMNGRPVGVMSSIQIFKMPGKKSLVDLYASNDAPVHPGIKNIWWIENNIDPSYKNAPKRDADQDGFSNKEEHDAKTDPSSADSHPEVIGKLLVKGNKKYQYKVIFSSHINEEQNKFSYQDQKMPKPVRSDYVKAGDTIFAADSKPAKRFKLEKVFKKGIEKGGYTKQVVYAKIKDTEKGGTFEIPKGSKNDFIGADFEVTFALNALGQGREKFSLPENTRFDLPGGKASPKGKYHFLEVRNGKDVIIKYKDGSREKEISIPLN